MPRKKKRRNQEQLLESCLAAFIHAGTLDLSLDQLAKAAGSNKRMLIHYFGGRDAIEEMAMSLLEDRLRARFQASAFPADTPLRSVVAALWEQTTSAESRGVLLLAMDAASVRGCGFVGADNQCRIPRRTSVGDGPDAAKLERLGTGPQIL